MDRNSLIFCVASLVVCIGVAWVSFPYAAMDADKVEMANTPQPAALMPMIDVGQGFGELPAEELIFYYVENPPAPVQTGAAAAPEIKFGGC